MESQMHRTQYDDPLHATGTIEEEHGGETKSAMKKVKEKVEKLKDTIKHGHHHDKHDHKDHEQHPSNDSPLVKTGLVQPTVMGTPVLAEDLYATHSNIVDPPVRSFAQWEEEEKHGDPPPLSTGTYGTHPEDLSQFGHHPYTQHHQSRDNIEKIAERPVSGIGGHTGMEKDPYAANVAEAPPANYQTKVDDPTNGGGKEVGITGVLKSFDKMSVYDHEPHLKATKPDQEKPDQHVFTGSHDQFKPETVESPPLDTIATDPSNKDRSYSQKIKFATSAVTDKAAAVKGTIVSKLSSSGAKKGDATDKSHEGNTKPYSATDYAHVVADTLSGTLGPVYEKVARAGSSVMSKMQGSGQEENTENVGSPRVRVKEYLVNTFKPGDDDKMLSETITNVFHRRKGNVPMQETITETTTAYVIKDEGERRLQEN
ncbi:low-temperature-induced 65 kDa protein-like [Rutidosis leptorrhynchoides]|uniref:low-temperature-induced 65 kDa protein-like n=1 Tax=Rutidosis leptorrhynchoides TaxID=125765 RepID=UPI003A995ECF